MDILCQICDTLNEVLDGQRAVFRASIISSSKFIFFHVSMAIIKFPHKLVEILQVAFTMLHMKMKRSVDNFLALFYHSMRNVEETAAHQHASKMSECVLNFSALTPPAAIVSHTDLQLKVQRVVMDK